jgi:hypothetical protein
MEGKMLKPLLKEASSRARVEKLIGDGGYDSKDNFQMLHDAGIDRTSNQGEEQLGCKWRMHSKRQDSEGTAF